MTLWDASAIVPLVVTEANSARLRQLARAEPEIAVWWGTEVECASAIARLERDAMLDDTEAQAAFDNLDDLSQAWLEIDPTPGIRHTARRLLRVHALRAGDALQLAAAHVAASRWSGRTTVVTLDDRLATAARREGFTVVS